MPCSMTWLRSMTRMGMIHPSKLLYPKLLYPKLSVFERMI